MSARKMKQIAATIADKAQEMADLLDEINDLIVDADSLSDGVLDQHASFYSYAYGNIKSYLLEDNGYCNYNPTLEGHAKSIREHATEEMDD